MGEVLTCVCGNQAWIISGVSIECTKCTRRLLLIDVSRLNDDMAKAREARADMAEAELARRQREET